MDERQTGVRAIVFKVALAFSIAGCSSHSTPRLAPTQATAAESVPRQQVPLARIATTAAPVEAALQVGGRIRTYQAEALMHIPQAPPLRELGDDACRHEKPILPESLAAVRKGWHALQQLAVGEYRAVHVSRGAKTWAGLHCVPSGGAVLVFRGGDIVAWVYDRAVDEGDPFSGIQSIGLVGETLRIYGHVHPVAQLDLTASIVKLEPLPAFDSVCDGGARIPRVEGMPYPQARARLMATAWTPQPSEDESLRGMVDGQILDAGYDEVITCGGTGANPCEFGFSNDRGDWLVVDTAGEVGRLGDQLVWPEVMSARVECLPQVEFD